MNWEEEIITLKVKVAKIETDIDNLLTWQATQNGSLQRLDSKVDNIHKMLMGGVAALALSLVSTVITLLVTISSK